MQPGMKHPDLTPVNHWHIYHQGRILVHDKGGSAAKPFTFASEREIHEFRDRYLADVGHLDIRPCYISHLPALLMNREAWRKFAAGDGEG